MTRNVDVHKELIHTRSIKTQVFRRDDGLWEIEAYLLDTKGKDFHLASGVKKQGEPIHEMKLWVLIDTQFNILDASSESLAVPYEGSCERINGDYKKLIGLNLVQGFRKSVHSLLSGIQGCSHITELCSVLPTTAIQAFAGEVIKIRDHAEQNSEEMPFQLNRCHALRTDGEVVKKYHPKWFDTPLEPREIPKKRGSDSD